MHKFFHFDYIYKIKSLIKDVLIAQLKYRLKKINNVTHYNE